MRSKRAQSAIDGCLGVETSLTEGSTSTTVTKGSTSHMTTAMGSQTDQISIQESINVPSQENENDEKENVPPLNSQEPLQVSFPKPKRPKKRHSGSREGKSASATLVEDQDERTMLAGSTTSRGKKSRGAIPARGEQDGMDTIAGRLVAMRRHEALEDRLARELTVLPLADLSEAYGIAEPPIVSDITPAATDAATRQEEGIQQLKGQPDTNEAEEKPLSHAIIAADLQAALRLLAETTNEHRRLPNALQRHKRGIKRALDLPIASGSSRANVIDNTRNSTGIDTISSSSRPTKRIRKSAHGCETPKVTSAELNEDVGVLRVPQNSPENSRYIATSTEDVHLEVPVPMPSFDLPDSNSEGVLASVSTRILIPGMSLRDVFSASSNQESEEREGEETMNQTASSFDTTEGSSHFSSFSELGSIIIGEHLHLPSSPEIDG